VAFILEALLIVLFLQLGWGVRGLLAAFAGRYLFSATANAVLACRALPGLKLSPRQFDPSLLKSFFGYGAGMQASGLIAAALQSADRLLAGALIGPQATALMDLASKLPGTTASVTSSAAVVAQSASARHDAHGQAGALRGVYLDATRVTVASLALTMPFLAWFAQPLTLAWLGQGEAQATVAPLMAMLSVGLHLHMLTAPATSVARGRGQLGADFIYHGLRVVAGRGGGPVAALRRGADGVVRARALGRAGGRGQRLPGRRAPPDPGPLGRHRLAPAAAHGRRLRPGRRPARAAAAARRRRPRPGAVDAGRPGPAVGAGCRRRAGPAADHIR